MLPMLKIKLLMDHGVCSSFRCAGLFVSATPALLRYSFCWDSERYCGAVTLAVWLGCVFIRVKYDKSPCYRPLVLLEKTDHLFKNLAGEEETPAPTESPKRSPRASPRPS